MLNQSVISLLVMGMLKETSRTVPGKDQRGSYSTDFADENFLTELASMIKNPSDLNNQMFAFALPGLNRSIIGDIDYLGDAAPSMGGMATTASFQIQSDHASDRNKTVELSPDPVDISHNNPIPAQIPVTTILTHVISGHQDAGVFGGADKNRSEITPDVSMGYYTGHASESFTGNLNADENSIAMKKESIPEAREDTGFARPSGTGDEEEILPFSGIPGKSIPEPPKGYHTDFLPGNNENNERFASHVSWVNFVKNVSVRQDSVLKSDSVSEPEKILDAGQDLVKATVTESESSGTANPTVNSRVKGMGIKDGVLQAHILPDNSFMNNHGKGTSDKPGRNPVNTEEVRASRGGIPVNANSGEIPAGRTADRNKAAEFPPDPFKAEANKQTVVDFPENLTLAGLVGMSGKEKIINYGTDTIGESGINSVNIKPETYPSGTLSQIGSSAKSLELLGNGITDNILQKAKLHIQGDKSEMRVQLSPPELGTMTLELSMENDMLEAKITVERFMVKEIVEEDIPRIRALFTNSDINVNKIDVFLQEKEGGIWGSFDKDFRSGSRGGYLYNHPDQGNECFEDTTGENPVVYDAGSNQVNYFV